MFGELRWRSLLINAARKAGLTKDPWFHDLRHTNVSWLRDGDFVDVAIRDIVGHSDESMTKSYGSITRETRTRASECIDQRLLRTIAR